jgi:hypothetical protein
MKVEDQTSATKIMQVELPQASVNQYAIGKPKLVFYRFYLVFASMIQSM